MNTENSKMLDELMMPLKALPVVSEIWSTPDGDQLIGYMARVSNSKATPEDPADKLIGYLLRNHHWSPFEMASMCMEVHTTRDISAQVLRHRSFSFQEFSTRYADVERLERWIECRFQDNKNRQNSWTADEMKANVISHGETPTSLDATISYFDAVVNESAVRSMEAYEELRKRGVAKEVARRILPIGLIPTRIYMSGTVRSWIHYIAERSKPGVQKEHRGIAIQAASFLHTSFPNTFRACCEAGIFEAPLYVDMEPRDAGQGAGPAA